MTQFFIFLLTLLVFISSCAGQTQSVQIIKKKNSDAQFKDFVVDNDKLWALTSDGRLFLFDISNGDPLPNTIKNDSAIIILTKDNEGNIIIADKSNSIKKYERTTNSWTSLFSFKNTLRGITCDSKNNLYLITNKGIYDNKSKKYFFPDSSQNFQIRHGAAGWFREPVYMTDRDDNIWIGFGYGEWGGELFIFNSRNKKFIAPDLESFPITLNPIKSI